MNVMYYVYFSILKVQILVDPVDLFQITYFHYIIWNSCNSYQNHCILSVLYWVPRVWSFSVLTIDSVNTSCIQISQYLFFWFWGHYSFPICIWSFTVISKSRRAFGKKCQTWTWFPSAKGIEVRCVFLLPLQRDVEVVPFQMTEVSSYQNYTFINNFP